MPEIEPGQYDLVVYVDPVGNPQFALRHLVDACPWIALWPGEGGLAKIMAAAIDHYQEGHSDGPARDDS